MKDTNVVILIGRVVRDAELKYTNSGMAICSFSVAVNRRRKNGNEYVDEASFFDVNILGNYGEVMHSLLTKGKQVSIEGELEQQRWTNQAGENRSKIHIIARNLQVFNSTHETQKKIAETTGRESQSDFEDDIAF